MINPATIKQAVFQAAIFLATAIMVVTFIMVMR